MGSTDTPTPFLACSPLPPKIPRDLCYFATLCVILGLSKRGKTSLEVIYWLHVRTTQTEVLSNLNMGEQKIWGTPLQKIMTCCDFRTYINTDHSLWVEEWQTAIEDRCIFESKELTRKVIIRISRCAGYWHVLEAQVVPFGHPDANLMRPHCLGHRAEQTSGGHLSWTPASETLWLA